MAVKEATVYENNSMVLREHQIRFSREPAIVKPVSKTGSKQQLPYYQFWLRVRAADSGHVPAAGRPVVNVYQSNSH
jgi:hypothetical protein